MLQVFSWCTDPVMALSAVQRRTLELSGDMAVGAVDEVMSADQWKASGKVIKAFYFRLFCLSLDRQHQ